MIQMSGQPGKVHFITWVPEQRMHVLLVPGEMLDQFEQCQRLKSTYICLHNVYKRTESTLVFISLGYPGTCTVYLGNRCHQDALWEESKPLKSWCCCGQYSAGTHWVLAIIWMLPYQLSKLAQCSPLGQQYSLMSVVFF